MLVGAYPINDMFFVGNGGQIHHYDGTKFTDMVSPTTKDLRSVWGTSSTNVWACGYNSTNDESVLIHYDGNSWTEDPFSISQSTRNYGIGAVWSFDSAGHKFTAISGTRVLRKTDNGSWRLDTSALKNELPSGGYIGIGISGNTSNDMMALGGWGFVAHWNGKTWKRYDQLLDYNNPFYGAAAFSMKGNTACAVGVKSGNSWVAIGRRK